MVIKELKEGETLVIKEAFDTILRPILLPNDRGYNIWDRKYNTWNRIKTKIYTDGEIEYNLKKENENREEEAFNYFFSDGTKYDQPVDRIVTKNIYLTNYSYIITYVMALELDRVGKVYGWFDYLKEITIYLNDINDKEALKTAKKAIKDIYNHKLSNNNFEENKLKHFEEEKLNDNIHKLVKKL